MPSFGKINRLRKNCEFQKVFCHGSKNTSKYFIMLKTKNNLNFCRLGLVITKKKIPLAVNRNKIKRLIRESFRLNVNNINSINFNSKITSYYDIIFMVKYNITQETNKNILSDLYLILKDIC